MKRIIIPVDFTPESENTVEYGMNMAKELGFRAFIVHIIDLYEYDFSLSYPEREAIPELSGEYIKMRTESAQESLKNLEESLREKFPDQFKHVQTAVETGVLSHYLVEISREESTGMILLTERKQEEDFLSKFVNDGNYNVIKEAKCPVYIIPTEATYKPYENIMYATDYREEDIPTLQKISRMARKYSPRIYALHLVNDMDFNMKVRQAGFQKMVQDKVGYDNIEIIDAKTNLGVEKIDEVAREKQANLIVMLKENKPFLERVFTTSLTKELVMHTTLPVLVYHENNH
jgi:nucleotide-binding universal stress UspA family protein